jgi:thiamine biosynthesis lipoprotein
VASKRIDAEGARAAHGRMASGTGLSQQGGFFESAGILGVGQPSDFLSIFLGLGANVLANVESAGFLHVLKNADDFKAVLLHRAGAGELCSFQERVPSMGAVFEIQIRSECGPKQKLWGQIRDLLSEMENEMSLYQKNSPINELNEKSELRRKTRHLSEVLRFSLAQASATRSQFNVAVLPALKLIEDSFRKSAAPPAPAQLLALKPLMDQQKIEVAEGRVKMPAGMKITLDGVAKGYAVDEVVALIEQAGVPNYLVNFSGNMRWKGEKEAKTPWKIASWDPVGQKIVSFAAAHSGSVASSGPEHASFSEDRKWHHLIDPESLKPARVWAQTTVRGPSAALCDVLSTATFVMSEAEIRQMIAKNYPGYQVRVVDWRGRVRDL